MNSSSPTRSGGATLIRCGLVATAVTLLTTACGTTAPSGGSGASGGNTAAANAITVHSVFGNMSDPYWATVACSAQQEANKQGLTYKAFTSQGTDATQLGSLFDSAALGNPNAVLLNVPQADQFAQRVQSLMQRGVPVAGSITLNPPPYAMVNPDNTPPSKMVELVTGAVSGGGSVFVLGGAPGIKPLENRYTPLTDALKQKGVNVLPVEYSTFDPTKAQSAVNSALLANPSLSLIIAADGPDTQGAIAAVRALGRQDNIKIVSFDSVPPAVQALRDGLILAIGAAALREIGAEEVQLVVDFIKKNGANTGPVSPIQAPAPKMGLLTKDNIDDPSMQGYIYSTECK